MKKVLVICNAGASSSMLVEALQKYSDANNMGYHFDELPSTEIRRAKEFDIVLLAPQIRYMQKQVEAAATGPSFLIAPQDYGLLNAENIIKMIEA